MHHTLIVCGNLLRRTVKKLECRLNRKIFGPNRKENVEHKQHYSDKIAACVE